MYFAAIVHIVKHHDIEPNGANRSRSDRQKRPRKVTPIMNKDQSLRARLCRTKEEQAKHLRQMGWPIIWKNAYSFKARLSLTSKPLATRPVFAQRAFFPFFP
jgi:hypothetical protein